MSDDRILRVALLGFTLPDDVLSRVMTGDATHATQTHTFAWAVVNGLRDAGCTVRLLSAAPVSNYPRNRRIRFRADRFHHDGIDGQQLGFLNVLGIKHLSRFFSAWWHGGRSTRRDPIDVLLVHGVHTPFLWCGWALARRRKIPVVPILTDPPGVGRPGEGRAMRLLRGLDVALVRAALRRCSGVIALTRPLAEDFAPGRPSLIMEGICTPPQVVGTPARGRTREIIYAGGLSRSYGVDRLVEAFRGLSDPDLRLSIFGRGELEPWLRDQAMADPRIAPPDLIDRSRLGQRLAGAAVLVNPRPVDQYFVPYSFPSKIIEYLAIGVPVVTTSLPSIPADYRPYLVQAATDTAEGLRAAIERVLDMPAGEAAALGAAGRDFVVATRNRAVQGQRMRDFLGGLTDRSADPGSTTRQAVTGRDSRSRATAGSSDRG
ncbi:glycosyltransferase [Micromonospora sp. NBC_01638]|uniref:glycosyltransferase n=1 Tax=Micromonospora sp. NBC_01638 TaxID=2975982 RepID=UPI00386CF405|nr:glycosyltransferase [Micromonospora sp. NBC_01638]